MIQNKMRIVVVPPGNIPQERMISGTLESFQDIVKGNIEVTTDDRLPGMLLVVNDEGKINEMRFCRKIFTNSYPDYIFGTFFVVGNGKDDFVSLTDEQVQQVKTRFKFGLSFKNLKRPT